MSIQLVGPAAAGVVMSVALSLLAVGHLVLNDKVTEELDGVQVAGMWCALAMMVATAAAWGHWVNRNREVEYQLH